MGWRRDKIEKTDRERETDKCNKLYRSCQKKKTPSDKLILGNKVLLIFNAKISS